MFFAFYFLLLLTTFYLLPFILFLRFLLPKIKVDDFWKKQTRDIEIKRAWKRKKVKDNSEFGLMYQY